MEPGAGPETAVMDKLIFYKSILSQGLFQLIKMFQKMIIKAGMDSFARPA